MVGLLGKKIGITRGFDEDGRSFAVTVVQAGPCAVTQIKTKDQDGYDAVQLGFDQAKEKHTTKPLLGHFKSANAEPVRFVRELRGFDGVSELKLGDQVKAGIFSPGDRVSVVGISKGKGFQGVVKRHGFAGGPRTHGQSDRHRAPGSIGQSSTPSRVLKGTRMAGRMGNRRVTVQNLEVIKVDEENGTLLIKGSVPGGKNGYLIIKK